MKSNFFGGNLRKKIAIRDGRWRGKIEMGEGQWREKSQLETWREEKSCL